jgi:glycosyltransferase involved in cell wall biosynthesis
VIDAEPLITVIIPTFRRPKLLRRAILSVLNQTFSAFQVCVYDDASNDNTQKVVTELAEADSRIKYYCHEQNIGVVENFNYGLKEVNTPFFRFSVMMTYFCHIFLKWRCSLSVLILMSCFMQG